jgi:hypothetical protein
MRLDQIMALRYWKASRSRHRATRCNMSQYRAGALPPSPMLNARSVVTRTTLVGLLLPRFLALFISVSAGESTAPYENLAKRLLSIPQLTKEREILDEVPVLAVDVGRDSSERALAIEIAENTTRRSYTRKEIEVLAERLKAAGYKTKPGKPKKGEIAAITALQAAVGKSARQIKRILEGETSGKTEWDKSRALLVRAAGRIAEAGKRRTGADDVKLVEAAQRILRITGKKDGSKET